MDPAQALSELTEISSQIQAACLLDSDGNILANTLEVPHTGDTPLVQLEAAMLDGSVFVVIEGDRAVAAVTKAEPTVGLVFYDLKSCLRAAGTPGDGDGKPRPRAGKRETARESAA
jgi:hypothetical protein